MIYVTFGVWRGKYPPKSLTTESKLDNWVKSWQLSQMIVYDSLGEISVKDELIHTEERQKFRKKLQDQTEVSLTCCVVLSLVENPGGEAGRQQSWSRWKPSRKWPTDGGNRSTRSPNLKTPRLDHKLNFIAQLRLKTLSPFRTYLQIKTMRHSPFQASYRKLWVKINLA